MSDDVLLGLSIEKEKQELLKNYPKSDIFLLNQMMQEINETIGTNIQFLAELERTYIKGAGNIVSKYIGSFTSESIRAYLIFQLVLDRIKNCDCIIYELYIHFKNSDEYISKCNQPAPAHIYVRYDNALKKLKPKRMKAELLELAHHPRDAFYLPLTLRMLSSWRISEMEEVLVSYLDDSNITTESIQLPDDANNYYPTLSSIQRELKFSSIAGLKYYPSKKNIELIRVFTKDSDRDISIAANKVLKSMNSQE